MNKVSAQMDQTEGDTTVQADYVRKNVKMVSAPNVNHGL
jgi:hypothetical protein